MSTQALCTCLASSPFCSALDSKDETSGTRLAPRRSGPCTAVQLYADVVLRSLCACAHWCVGSAGPQSARGVVCGASRDIRTLPMEVARRGRGRAWRVAAGAWITVRMLQILVSLLQMRSCTACTELLDAFVSRFWVLPRPIIRTAPKGFLALAESAELRASRPLHAAR